MTCHEFKDLVALFALGGLDPAERAACEAHLQSPGAHDGCLEALGEAMTSVSSLDDNVPAPPAHVWAKIEHQVGPSARQQRRARRVTFATMGFAAAAVAAIVFVQIRGERREAPLVAEVETLHVATRHADEVAASITRERDACRAQLERDVADRVDPLRAEAADLLQLPGTTLFPLGRDKAAAAGASANAIMHTGVKRAYVVADGLTPGVDGDYQMWIAKSSHVVPAGLVHVDPRGRAVVRIDYASLLGDVGAPDAIMITLEPRGGSQVVRGPTILIGSPRKT
jgi:anti-sigma-K factor RskA